MVRDMDCTMASKLDGLEGTYGFGTAAEGAAAWVWSGWSEGRGLVADSIAAVDTDDDEDDEDDAVTLGCPMMLSNADDMVVLLALVATCPLPPAVLSADTNMLDELPAELLPAPVPCPENGMGLDPRCPPPMGSDVPNGFALTFSGEGSWNDDDDNPVLLFAATSRAPTPMPIFPVSSGLLVLFCSPAPATKKLSDACRCLGCSTSTGPPILPVKGISKSSSCPTPAWGAATGMSICSRSILPAVEGVSISSSDDDVELTVPL
jgi:hypothetical protein